MTKTNKEIQLSDFLVDSLCLNGNTISAARPMYPHKDPYSNFYDEDPLNVLGEVTFKEAKEVPEEEVGTPIQEFFRGVNVFITGGSGFLGKVLTEKLLRAVPHIGHVYLLIRPKRGKSCQERFQRLMEDKVFSRMKAEKPQYRSKITALAGDLSEPDLGLRDEDRQLLQESVHVVFHCAADVNFLEPLRKAVTLNVLGSRRVMDLARDMKNLKAYVHVSTAYSQCVNKVIEERVPKMCLNYKDILSYLEMNSDSCIDAKEKRILQGWPNTYTFSKALCEEMVQEEANGLPISIYRPAVVTNSYNEPVRGWADNLNGPIGLNLAVAVGVLHIAKANLNQTTDIVPVDYVVNCMIAVAWDTGMQRDQRLIKVFNFNSSSQNMITNNTFYKMKQAVEIWPSSIALWYPFFMFTDNPIWYSINRYLLHTIPGYVIDKLAPVFGHKPRMTKIYNGINKMNDVMQYFLMKFWDIKNDNTKELLNSLTPEDKQFFNFDLRNICWVEYGFISWLGLRYYYLKETMESIPAAKKRFKWFRVAHVGLKMVCGLAVLKLAVCVAHVLPI